MHFFPVSFFFSIFHSKIHIKYIKLSAFVRMLFWVCWFNVICTWSKEILQWANNLFRFCCCFYLFIYSLFIGDTVLSFYFIFFVRYLLICFLTLMKNLQIWIDFQFFIFSPAFLLMIDFLQFKWKLIITLARATNRPCANCVCARKYTILWQ